LGSGVRAANILLVNINVTMHGIAVMYVYSVRPYAKYSGGIHLAYMSPFAILSSAELYYSIHPLP
jgi:hypothetical protein